MRAATHFKVRMLMPDGVQRGAPLVLNGGPKQPIVFGYDWRRQAVGGLRGGMYQDSLAVVAPGH